MVSVECAPDVFRERENEKGDPRQSTHLDLDLDLDQDQNQDQDFYQV